MKSFTKTAAAVIVALSAFAGAASAQDYGYWAEGSISPWGMEMYDQYGDSHYVDPYAYDSQVDNYGNVYSSYSGEMDPSIGMYDLSPISPNPYDYSSGGSSTYVPYENPVDSHQSFINSIWE
ncbi:hypothetical protein [Hyphomonas johnsonii]|uniref:Lipoprotein n=1 Tax=Hyphomonas johnsonii MHS-2 TaxID=1280950 RepID=A0A059FRY6_9PROT|nr:hypothetical protein [Hyphomonas johnsonii]KCZ93430.1 hypothetical protein HJO_06225 [Hyphomonas johnsonii MHS-2]